ncbi:MAG TPA: hypothetical protein PKC89_11495 [Pyrinomonadaceae bacterium]|nr:hypothetical protein [Pyrinomonadaceae bacterium]
MEHTITLLTGYTDKKGELHREVTFGKRLSVGDIMLLDSDPRATSPTQYNDLVMRRMITKFGSLPLPIGDGVLASLDTIDREDLRVGGDRFLKLSRGDDRKGEILDAETNRLAFGFEIDGTPYPLVKFGRMQTGNDEYQADALGLTGVSRECFLLGTQIASIESEDGTRIEGPIGIKDFASLDGEDLVQLRSSAHLRRLSFRFSRESISRERNGENNLSANGSDGNDGEGVAEASSPKA